jgi:hypothetical protein
MGRVEDGERAKERVDHFVEERHRGKSQSVDLVVFKERRKCLSHPRKTGEFLSHPNQLRPDRELTPEDENASWSLQHYLFAVLTADHGSDALLPRASMLQRS